MAEPVDELEELAEDGAVGRRVYDSALGVMGAHTPAWMLRMLSSGNDVARYVAEADWIAPGCSESLLYSTSCTVILFSKSSVTFYRHVDPVGITSDSNIT